MVFKRLFGRKEKPAPAPAEWRVPPGQRVYAIGDIHGRLDLLDELLAQIDKDDEARGAANTHLIFLGDLVDRGPDSRGVVERVMALMEAGDHVRCLGGNHEDILLTCHDGDTKSVPLFDRVGGRATLLSYGVSEEDYDEADAHQLPLLLQAAVPKDHIRFMRNLEDWVQIGDYLFVHAGLRPGVALDDQSRTDVRWIRRDFTDSQQNHGLMVVHGHTITEAVDAHPNRIGIDTGAYASGKLTAIGVEGSERWFLQTGQ